MGRLCSQLQSRSPLYVVHSPFGWFYHRCHCNCRDLVLFVVAMSCGGLDGAYNSIWDSVRPMTGKYITYYFQYHGFVRCVCMLNYWFSRYDTICADNTSTSGSSCRPVSQCEVGVVSVRRPSHVICPDNYNFFPVLVEGQVLQ